jgi:hypothetical protein
MANKYGDTRLRRHRWEWLSSGSKANSYLPYYEYQPASRITDIWEEWTTGLNGFLSTRELEEGWGPSWRRNQRPLKTERSRRKKVVDLILKLESKRNWTTDLALRFTRERYEMARDSNGKLLYPTARSFADYLQKKAEAGKLNGWAEVLFESNSYS